MLSSTKKRILGAIRSVLAVGPHSLFIRSRLHEAGTVWTRASSRESVWAAIRVPDWRRNVGRPRCATHPTFLRIIHPGQLEELHCVTRPGKLSHYEGEDYRVEAVLGMENSSLGRPNLAHDSSSRKWLQREESGRLDQALHGKHAMAQGRPRRGPPSGDP